MASSGRTTLGLALSQAPECVEGEGQRDLGTPKFCNPCIGFGQAPEHVEGEGYDMREEKIMLDTQQMTA
jgi:hypothetical protein